MKVAHRSIPPSLPTEVSAQIRDDVEAALRSIQTATGRFVVNDSEWLARRERKYSPVVMNAAEFISKQFQTWLDEHGWDKETTIQEQKIDVYRVFNCRYSGYYLSDSGFKALLDKAWHEREAFAPFVQCFWPTVEVPAVDQLVWWLAQMYVSRRVHDISSIPREFHEFFESTGEIQHEIRVGVEFETGNIASAFRAFSKLNTLYGVGDIDLAVFVATNRATATRIWPTSNRNVSYDELENRRYRRNLYCPVWEVEFQPDGYSPDAPYLLRDGTTYQPKKTKETVSHEGSQKPVFLRPDGTRVILSSS